MCVIKIKEVNIMKKQLQFLMALLIISVSANAQYLQADYYGFENADINGDGTNLAFGWWTGAHSDVLQQSDEYSHSGAYSLKIGATDYSSESDTWKIECGTSTKANSSPNITQAGDYILEFKLYIPSVGTPVNTIKLIYSDHANNFESADDAQWIQSTFDISSVTVRDKWVTMRKAISITAVGTLDVKGKQILLQVVDSYRPSAGSGYIYIDDVTLNDPVDTSDPDYIMDYTHFGFEYGDGSWWIPSAARVQAMVSSEEVASGAYALKIIADNSESAEAKLSPASSLVNGGSIKVISDHFYKASLKVFVESDKTYYAEFLTNLKGQTLEEGQPSVGYQTIKWTVPNDIAKDEWVGLTQIVHYSPDDLTAEEPFVTEVATAFNKTSIVGTDVGNMYIDDISFVKTEAYPVTFTIVRKDNGDPIQGVAVTIDGETYTSDEQGMITISGLEPGEYSYTVTMNGFYEVTSTITVDDASVNEIVELTVDSPTAVDDVNDADFKVYPNPASAVINIASPVGSTITLYSVSGNKIKVLNNSSNLNSINVNDIAKGLYIVEIVNNDRKVIEKVQVR